MLYLLYILGALVLLPLVCIMSFVIFILPWYLAAALLPFAQDMLLSLRLELRAMCVRWKNRNK